VEVEDGDHWRGVVSRERRPASVSVANPTRLAERTGHGVHRSSPQPTGSLPGNCSLRLEKYERELDAWIQATQAFCFSLFTRATKSNLHTYVHTQSGCQHLLDKGDTEDTSAEMDARIAGWQTPEKQKKRLPTATTTLSASASRLWLDHTLLDAATVE